MKVKTGEMRHRITIQKYTTTQNENGFDIEEWDDYKTVWASMNNLWGKEFYAAKATNSENTIEFIVRYSKDLKNINTKEYRIKTIKDKNATKEKNKYRYFDITFIDNIQYKNKWLKIKAIEVI
ncbi:phage head closure protein [Clostridium botulinum]|uniref:Putative phage head-tail adaptor n=1 Tax=Clostridium botulinum (strain Langeland / NCTC 10281 / Type F) TaxID=441772 RepID=A7GEE3_CLOBL|nr:phage head closure protein [Clostridium botulinum]ABS40873.1 putative phage head-tail adaptor [Clostridium botulinum F str. Langeland]ADF99571.1 putative phage head-tail adaptor [Clostridium botulinum F str. 230613]KKM42850.1 head-tail adaptor protein [Clostridium botulinum]MBY6791629.1 phage head closure protein [Clostridium botulinum]MBY6936865.1 phage head closure protein [Clostridium botulinum]